MKKYNFKTGLAAMVISTSLFISCSESANKEQESKEVAKEMNEDKFEGKANEKDAQFVVDATSASFDEVSIADVALNKSSNEDIKKLAQMLKDDHSAMITDLNAVASKKMITVPSVASAGAGEAAKKLTDTDMKNFDKAWLNKVEEMHEKSVRKYEDASSNATDAEIKSWFSATLPKIKGHLDMINQKQDMMK